MSLLNKYFASTFLSESLIFYYLLLQCDPSRNTKQANLHFLSLYFITKHHTSCYSTSKTFCLTSLPLFFLPICFESIYYYLTMLFRKMENGATPRGGHTPANDHQSKLLSLVHTPFKADRGARDCFPIYKGKNGILVSHLDCLTNTLTLLLLHRVHNKLLGLEFFKQLQNNL